MSWTRPATTSSASSPCASRRPRRWPARSTGLVIHDLPDDELDRYRPAVAAVSAEDVRAAATTYLDPGRASIVVVGDAQRFRGALEAAGYGEVEVVAQEDAPGAA